jgi:ArsR family transcriptional regulator
MSSHAPWTISASPRFEPFFALWSLTAAGARRHPAWRARTRQFLPSGFWSAFESMGSCAELWILLADAPGPLPLASDFEEIPPAIAAIAPKRFLGELLFSVLHHDPAVEALMAGAELREALRLVPRAKRDWLQFMGLYPPLPDAPGQAAIGRLLEDPAGFRDAAVEAVRMFWRDSFAETWRTLLPQFEPAMARARRILKARDWAALERFGLNVEIDARGRRLSALRGGYSIGFDEARAIHLMPSAFNERKFWTVLRREGRDTVYLPFLDLAAGPDPIARSEEESAADPALVFRALGDATRWAMVRLIARGPIAAADLARWLGLTKPTVSHHLHELRQAELIEETPEGRSVLLTVNWNTLERLSALATAELRHAQAAAGPMPLTRRSRR